MNWQGTVERTVTGLGYELVDAERSAGGLLRVMIDHPRGSADTDPRASADTDPRASAEDHPAGPRPDRFITVDDCEKVTRQLQHVLEVEGVIYERLEVSSPGLDRPLKKAADYARFAGEQVELTLKEAFQGRKKWSGELRPNGEGWRLVLADAAPDRRAKRAAAAAGTTAAADTVLDFSLDEVREAHLVPVVDFKGRRFAAERSPHAAREGGELDGGGVL